MRKRGCDRKQRGQPDNLKTGDSRFRDRTKTARIGDCFQACPFAVRDRGRLLEAGLESGFVGAAVGVGLEKGGRGAQNQE